MHPGAGPSTCSGPIIDSHSIQRKGPLSAIVDERNHVLHFTHEVELGVAVDSIGWRKASTFPGFCSQHDSEIFSALERGPFSGSHEQCVLQAYRAVTNELYRKTALIESLIYQRDHVDRGFAVDDQIDFQLSCRANLEGQRKSRDELERWWYNLGVAIESGVLESLASKVFWFKGDVGIVSSAALHVEYDFAGNKLFDMWDLSLEAEMIAHSVMVSSDGGAIVFVWDGRSQIADRLVRSFDALPSAHKGDAFVQYCVLSCENTYFSANWWRELTQQNQDFLLSLASQTYYEGGAFEPRSPLLVNWEFNG